MAIEAEWVGQERLSQIIKNFENLNKKSISEETENKILNTIGVAWAGTIKTNIHRGISFNGVPLLKPKKRDGNALLDTGRLVSSINPIVNSGVLRIGTPVYYSKFLNNGTQRIQPRPFIPEQQHQIPEAWWKVAEEITRVLAVQDIAEQLK